MAIHVCQSQKLEVLAQILLAQVNQPSENLLSALQSQHFIVPNPAIEHWLTQYIAQQHGISANHVFHHRIQAFQWFIYQHVLTNKDQVRQANLPRLVMKWRIYTVLSQLSEQGIKLSKDHPMYAFLQRIEDSASHLTDTKQKQQKKQSMWYWVAENVSKLFSHYMAYRGHCNQDHGGMPCSCTHNWLAKWGKGQHLNIETLISSEQQVSLYNLEQASALEAWQSWLWQHIFHDDFLNIQAIDDAFWQRLDDMTALERSEALPQQVIVFTLLDLPPIQLHFLRRLAHYIDITIYHYNPSQEYWADSVDPKWKKSYDAKVQQRFIEKNQQQGKAVSDEDLAHFLNSFNQHFDAESRESRHPLLTRFGKQARDHFSLLAGLSSGEEGEWADVFIDIDTDNLLHQLQADILYLMEPEANSYVLDEHDQSIQIHVCHTTLRQLEVLKTQLLTWLVEKDPTQPRRLDDILILTPALAEIEPLVRSVFAPMPNHQGKLQDDYLPIKMAGVMQFDLNNAWQAVLGRITLPEGRFQYHDFSDWLSLLATQRFYDLDHQAVERILQLLERAGFKRGLDATHLQRTLLANDTDYRYTFKFALDRLVKGVAVPEHVMVLDGLSIEDLMPEDFALVGVLIQIYQDFNQRRDWLYSEQSAQTTVEQWLFKLLDEVTAFEKQGETVLRSVKEVIQKQIRMLTLTANYEQRHAKTDDLAALSDLTLPLASVIQEISSSIESHVEQAIPSGAITFSEIGQIRPLPYRLVVLLNLDSGIFPSQQRHIPFDLMQVLRPILGDRSRLEDDQGAFLDALLLAKDALWLFYNGFDANGGDVRPPSAVLQELIDHLQLIVAVPEQPMPLDDRGLEVAPHLRPLYQLHHLQPFDLEYFSQTQPLQYKNQWFDVASQLQKNTVKRPAWVDTAVNTSAKTLRVIEQQQWLSDVTFPAQLYLKSLGVANLRFIDEIQDNEPLLLDGLGRYQIRDFLQQQQHLPDVDLLMDCLPVGKVQHSAWQQAQQAHEDVLTELKRYAPEPTKTTQDTLCVEEGLYIRIRIAEKGAQQWLSLQASSARAERCIKVWLEYLLWLSYLDLADEGTDLKRVVVFSNHTMICQGVSSKQAKAYLADWWQAWHVAQQTPLVLPAALLLKPIEDSKALTWQQVDEHDVLDEKSMQLLLKVWENQYEYGAFSVSEDKASQYHQDWEFILQQQDRTALLQDACLTWSYRLYAPIYTQYVELCNHA
ncbi:exodeoxyribonuclease V subunit gamma [Acinetobacter boissieri]|uniref:RecBCD enzyme subunit RecC n=1 Tax=Acinetobacter boissieri TaxID=1219383 RepID=A0A1G6GH02_9GAMM|nr:exodeoxyribonuclease V subunit gamma [Acinetobacter boissieri]SDB81312.1 DNA helicase/exodeoxyribonuclease V, gamma subunit [Acinetobacter boissieri]